MVKEPQNGWIKLHRKILDWEWFDDGVTFHVFIYLLLKANVEDKKWHGLLIKRGQLVTSQSHISAQLSNKHHKTTIQQVRTALDKLKATGELTVKTTNAYSVISINNYSLYQQDNRQKTSKQQASQQPDNNQVTTTKEYKEYKEERNIYSEIINHYNSTFEKQTKSYASWKTNCDYHLKSYSLEDIKQAITNWKDNADKFWAKEPSLDLLFRTKNKNGQPCDYIDQLLNLKSARKLEADPLAGLVKKGNYVGN